LADTNLAEVRTLCNRIAAISDRLTLANRGRASEAGFS